MPTYKNNSDSAINYSMGGKIYSFPAGKSTGISIWIPYRELGLELEDENYPPVQSKILAGGAFKFGVGTERKINIPHCEKYELKVKVERGRLMRYVGNSPVGEEQTGESRSILSWEYAPYVKFRGLEADTEAKVYAEVYDG